MKKMFAALLMLVMLVMLAASAMAADPEIYVGGVGMNSGDYLASGAAATTTTEPSGGYAYYQDGVLTLNNYSYTGVGHAYDGSESAMIYAEDELELVLEGANRLKAQPESADQNVYGVRAEDNLTIEQNGTGSLTVKDAYVGIRARRNFEINNGEIAINDAKHYGIEGVINTLCVNGGKVTVNADKVGIQANSGLSVSGGHVEVASSNGYGINANNTYFTMTGGSLKTTGKEYGACLDKTSFNIKGGTFEAVSTDENGYAIFIITSNFKYNDAIIQASIDPAGTLGEYVAANNDQYKRVVVTAPVKYTVTFDSDGGSAVAAQTVVEGSKATKPADPTRSGYTFKGWTLGGTAYDFTAAVTGSITLKAKWEKDAEIWVGGVGMASGEYLANNAATTTTSKPSGGYAYYKDGVLTLHDYSYTGAGCAVGTEGDSALILTNKNLKLSLMGTNTLMASGSSKVYGIQVAESSSLTIEQSGAGTLMVKDTYRGISVKGDITLNSGSVTIDNASQDGILTWENLTIKGGKLDVDSRVRGIQLGGAGKKVTIEGGEVNIAADGHGILANLNNCTVEIKDGKTQIFGGYHGVNMPKSTLEITGGEVDIKATSTDSEKDAQYTAVNVATFDATGMNVRASTEPDGTLGAYVKSIHDTYDWIRIEPKEAIKYTVTVKNGTGGGDYAAGEKVTITAPDVSGKVFKEWTSADGVTFADPASTKTTFVMPEKNVTVTPVYNTIISVIDLSGITPPVAGAMPVNTFTISTSGVDYGAEIFWSRYDEANNKLEQQYPDATLVNNTPFRAGIYYKMQAEVWAKEGYIFTPETVIRYDGVELPVKDDTDLKKDFRYPVIAEYRDRTAASIGWAVAEEDPDEDELYPVVITKVLKGISAKDLPEGTVFNFVVIDGNNGDTQESAVITREELIAGNGTASTTIMTKYKGGMRIGEEIASAQLSAYEWVGSVAVSGDAEYQEIDKAYDVKPFVCTGLIKPETGDAVVTFTNEYTPVKADLPKTGDDSHLALWLAMLGMAGAAMLMLRKRHEA